MKPKFFSFPSLKVLKQVQVGKAKQFVLEKSDYSFISQEATKNIAHLLLDNTRESIEQFGKQGLISNIASCP